MSDQIRNPCENCGASNFTHVTPEGHKGALTRSVVQHGQQLQFVSNAGTPVDIYACEECGMIRLFAVKIQG